MIVSGVIVSKTSEFGIILLFFGTWFKPRVISLDWGCCAHNVPQLWDILKRMTTICSIPKGNREMESTSELADSLYIISVKVVHFGNWLCTLTTGCAL